LNEGYASFVEFLCVAHLFPEFDIWTQFVADTYIPALELDCLRNSHPIEVICYPYWFLSDLILKISNIAIQNIIDRNE
jgi:aminopeptidase N